MFRRILAAGAVAFMVSGCSMTPAPTPEQLYAEAQHACTTYGFKPETDAFADCMMKLDIYRMQAAQQQAQMDQAQFDASMRALAANRPVTCNTTAMASGGGRLSGGAVYGNSTTTCQ